MGTGGGGEGDVVTGGGPEIPGFEAMTPIGSGGSSTVYRAVDVRHQRPVAVKVLDAQTTTGPRRTAFQREIEAIGRIGSHPYIVTILGSGFTAGNHPYLVLPLFERGTYSDLVDEQGPMTWADAVDIGIKLCSAVETVHRAGVVHRDIKPGNVFVGVNTGQPLLADFGISSTVDGERTKTRTMAVTFGYTAPEVLDDERPTPASDLYSLAMTVYRLIHGLHAYYAETPAAVMRKVLAEPDRPRLPAGVPADLAEVVAGALARNPADRPASALALARSLQRVQADHSLPPTPVVVADEPAVDHEDRSAAPPVDPPPAVAAQAVAAPVDPAPATATPAVEEESSGRPRVPPPLSKVDRDHPIEASIVNAISAPAEAKSSDPQRTTVDVAAVLAAAIGLDAPGSSGDTTPDQADDASHPVGSGSGPPTGGSDTGADGARTDDGAAATDARHEGRRLDLPTVVTPRRPRADREAESSAAHTPAGSMADDAGGILQRRGPLVAVVMVVVAVVAAVIIWWLA